MTIVKGQIDSLKKLKASLNERGITRFSSIGEINLFLKTFGNKKQEIIDQTKKRLNSEIKALQADRIRFQEHYDIQKIDETNNLNNRIGTLSKNYDLIKSKNSVGLRRAYNFLQLKVLKFRKAQLEKNFNRILHKKTLKATQKLEETNRTLDQLTANREQVISDRSLPGISELTITKEVIDSLRPLIAGAIGENLVVSELKKLSDKHILYNDFSIDFKPPIYNKKEDDRILSIQIDHLLLTNAGIFLIETKNWSKKSISNFNLRSPIQQIKRASFALFVILNSDKNDSGFILKRHHWGDKKLPIRSLVVMINNKPKEKFKYVTVKTLQELNNYVSYFNPIFDDTEVKRISKYLEKIKN